MSKRFPECPAYNHESCRCYRDKNVCAIVREDKTCLKKKLKVYKTKVTLLDEHNVGFFKCSYRGVRS